MVGKDTLFHDYMWTIGYYLVLQVDGSSDYMFPSFYSHIINPKDKKFDSQVALAFSRCLKIIIEILKKYCSEETQT